MPPCVVGMPDAALAAGQLNAGAGISAFEDSIGPGITEIPRLREVSKRNIDGFVAGRGNVQGFFLPGIINGVKSAVIRLVSDIVFSQGSARIVPEDGDYLADEISGRIVDGDGTDIFHFRFAAVCFDYDGGPLHLGDGPFDPGAEGVAVILADILGQVQSGDAGRDVHGNSFLFLLGCGKAKGKKKDRGDQRADHTDKPFHFRNLFYMVSGSSLLYGTYFPLSILKIGHKRRFGQASCPPHYLRMFCMEKFLHFCEKMLASHLKNNYNKDVRFLVLFC